MAGVQTRSSFPWVKVPEREADHTSTSTAEVKNAIPYMSS